MRVSSMVLLHSVFRLDMKKFSAPTTKMLQILITLDKSPN